jgi:hypothetical protein
MSIAEFCEHNRISEAHYYVMKQNGDGPREIHVGKRVLISPEAESAWRKAHEE